MKAPPLLALALAPGARAGGRSAPNAKAGTPKVEVVTLPPLRHFAIFDQPQHVADDIHGYFNPL
jgi:hypothetical protein